MIKSQNVIIAVQKRCVPDLRVIDQKMLDDIGSELITIDGLEKAKKHIELFSKAEQVV